MTPFTNGFELGFILGMIALLFGSFLAGKFLIYKRGFNARQIINEVQRKMSEGETRTYKFRFKKYKGRLLLENVEKTSDLY